MSVQLKTTRYGLSPRAGGWDNPGDGGTDAWQGNHGNTLNTSSCALTDSAESLLAATLPTDDRRRISINRLVPGTLLRITYLAPADKMVRYVTFDDRAPEADARLDIFLPWADDPMIPDFGFVSVV